LKAVSFIALGLSLVSGLVAAGAYYRVRTAPPAATGGSSEIESLKARLTQLERDFRQDRERRARLEGTPAPKDDHDHTAGSSGSNELADLKKRIETLERQLAPGRSGSPDRPPNVRPNPAIVEMQKKRLLDPAQPERSRASALGILRMQGSNKTDDVVDAGLSLLAGSKESNLRALVIRHLRGAENTRLVTPLIDVLKSDADEDVRDEAARTVGEYAAQPEVKAALEQAASSDASEKVKRQASAALAAPPKNK
jgi:HEAT repeat protein